jgi:arylsulfatase A-like enzyme
MRMIRTGDWKLIRHHFTNSATNYHLESDPGETKNLYDDPAARRARVRLQRQLTAWQRSIDDPILPRIGSLK